MPTSIRSLLRPLKRLFIRGTYRLLLSIPAGPSLYYVVNRRFAREHRATLVARLRHIEASSPSRAEERACQLDYRFRRNVHRLEKGLIMRPRRPIFALDYISDTLNIYEMVTLAARKGMHLDVQLIRWANDVLDEYFRVVASHPITNSARAKFSQMRVASSHVGRPFRPRMLEIPDDLPTFEQIRAMAWARRSVRWYESRPVQRDLIDKAVEIAGLAPSACNRQPYRYIVYDSPEAAARIGAIPLGTVGFAHNFQCIIVVIGDVGAYPDEKDRHLIYIDAGLATMSLQFALVSLGLGSCCINWPDIAAQEERIRQHVLLNETERVVMLISVGFPSPDCLVPYSAKKPLERLRSFPGANKAASANQEPPQQAA